MTWGQSPLIQKQVKIQAQWPTQNILQCFSFYDVFVILKFETCTTLLHIGKLILRSILDCFGGDKTSEMSVYGGLGFISWSKHCRLHSSNTFSFMSAPWCCSVWNYFSEYTAFWQDISPTPLLFSRSLALSLSRSVSLCVLRTHTETQTHTATCTQPNMHNLS